MTERLYSPVLPRRITVDVPPEWLRTKRGDGDALKRAKRQLQSLRAPLGDSDDARVLMGKLVQAERDGEEGYR